MALALGIGKRREHRGRQNGNYGNNHQQFDECESAKNGPSRGCNRRIHHYRHKC